MATQQLWPELLLQVTNKYDELDAIVLRKLKSRTDTIRRLQSLQARLVSLREVHEDLMIEESQVEQLLLMEKSASEFIDSTDNSRPAKKMKKACSVGGLEKEVAALQNECDVKRARVNAMNQHLQKLLTVRAQNAALENIDDYLAEIKLGPEATKEEILQAGRQVAYLLARKRAIDEKLRAEERALPPSHPGRSPLSKPCATSSEVTRPRRIPSSGEGAVGEDDDAGAAGTSGTK